MNASEFLGDKEGRRRIAKMSNWQFHLFMTCLQDKCRGDYEPIEKTTGYLSKNPARFVMYIAFCIGLRPWLWFGVTR